MLRSKYSKQVISTALIASVGIAISCCPANHALGLPQASLDNQEIPDDPDLKLAIEFIEVINSGDVSRYLLFNRNNRAGSPPTADIDAGRAEQYNQWKTEWNGLTVNRIEKDPRGGISITAETGHGQWLRFKIGFTEDHKITGMMINELEGPNVGQLTLEPWSNVQDLTEQVVKQSQAPAWAIAVVRDGKIIDTGIAGPRRIDKPNIPALLSDRFHWGSVGKSATGLLVAKAIEDGLLTRDTTIQEALPGVKMHESYRNATIDQLMSHRAGIPTYSMLNEQIIERMNALPGETDFQKRSSFVESVLMEEPVGPPGEQMQYSNAGIPIAANIVERLTNTPWDQLLKKHIFGPARMPTAGVGWPTDAGEGAVSGHIIGDEQLILIPPNGEPPANPGGVVVFEMGPHPVGLDPAGNIHSSIEDFARYALIHLNGLAGEDGHLKAETIQEIHTPRPGPGEPYTFGWAILDFNGLETHWHNGSAGNYFAEIYLFPSKNAGIVIFTSAFADAPQHTPIVVQELIDRYVK